MNFGIFLWWIKICYPGKSSSVSYKSETSLITYVPFVILIWEYWKERTNRSLWWKKSKEIIRLLILYYYIYVIPAKKMYVRWLVHFHLVWKYILNLRHSTIVAYQFLKFVLDSPPQRITIDSFSWSIIWT